MLPEVEVLVLQLVVRVLVAAAVKEVNKKKFRFKIGL